MILQYLILVFITLNIQLFKYTNLNAIVCMPQYELLFQLNASESDYV